MSEVEADLHLYPHFYSPQSGRRVPSLRKIVNGLSKKGGIVALSACHTATSGVDTRFRDYMDSASGLEDKYKVAHGDSGGWFSFTRRSEEAKPLILVSSQVVRAYSGDMPVDINVIGVPEIIEPSRGVNQTAHESKAKGGIVLLCNVGSSIGVSVENAEEMYNQELMDAIQVRAGEGVAKHLIDEGVRSIAVTGGHHYSLAHTSHSIFDGGLIQKGLIENFSIGGLKEHIEKGWFGNHYGEISKLQRFMSRDRHILASGPGHILAGGKRRDEFLRAVGLRKSKN